MFISWLIASICFGQPEAAMKNMPSGWFTTVASCVWLALPHRPTSQETNSTCWWNLESLSHKHTIWSIFHISRCDYTVPISYTGCLDLMPGCLIKKMSCVKPCALSKWKIASHLPSSLLSTMKSDGRTSQQSGTDTTQTHVSFSVCIPSLSVHSSPPVLGLCSAGRCWLCGGSPASADRTTRWRLPPQSTECAALENSITTPGSNVVTSYHFLLQNLDLLTRLSSLVRC